MGRYVDVQEVPSIVLDDEPDIEQLESNGRDDEEVHRGDHVSVVSQERGPALSLGVIRPPLWQVARHRRQRNPEPSLRSPTENVQTQLTGNTSRHDTPPGPVSALLDVSAKSGENPIKSESEPPNLATETNANCGAFQARNAQSPVRLRQGPRPKPRATAGFWAADPGPSVAVSDDAD